MGRSRPRKKAAQTPPARIRVFSQGTNSTERIQSTNSLKQHETIITEIPILEPIVEEVEDEKHKKKEDDSDKTQPQLWVDVIKGIIEEQYVISEMHFWANALIMYVVGDDLSMNAIKKFIMNTWSFVTPIELYYNEDGYFLVRFKSKSDKDAVLMRAIYHLQETCPTA